MKKEFKQLLAEHGRTQMPKVLLASAECAPLSKTGGLADVVGTLPKALKKLGIDARVITPYHRVIKDKYRSRVEHVCDFRTWLGWRHAYVGVEKLEIDGVIVYLIDNEQYFNDRIYLGGNAEGEQYSFFCRAVLDALPCLDFCPDVLHCNDWHTAIIPMLAKTQYPGGMQEKLKFLLTIHNIAFQGKFGFDFVQDMFGIDSRYYNSEMLEHNGCANYLKAGCMFSDRINTVSPTYSHEIRTPYYGEGLDGVLNARADVLTGIINGIDKDTFNSRGDAWLPAGYDRGHLGGKAKCKAKLQEMMSLEQREDVAMFAMVTRMTEQKGFDLVASVLENLMSRENVQFMLLGTGDARFENFMRGAEERYKGRLCAYIGYSEELSHLVYAGSDFFLMPSRFEPCGLSQMIAMRYGSLPIVRETGGLKDTVTAYNKYTGEGNGFSFANYSPDELSDAIGRALECWEDKAVMKQLISQAMQTDFGFELSAEEYARHYIWIL